MNSHLTVNIAMVYLYDAYVSERRLSGNIFHAGRLHVNPEFLSSTLILLHTVQEAFEKCVMERNLQKLKMVNKRDDLLVAIQGRWPQGIFPPS